MRLLVSLNLYSSRRRPILGKRLTQMIEMLGNRKEKNVNIVVVVVVVND